MHTVRRLYHSRIWRIHLELMLLFEMASWNLALETQSCSHLKTILTLRLRDITFQSRRQIFCGRKQVDHSEASIQVWCRTRLEEAREDSDPGRTAPARVELRVAPVARVRERAALYSRHWA